MKTSTTPNRNALATAWRPASLALALSLFALNALAGGVFPPHSHPYGKSYSEWSAALWQWSMQLPLAGHPAVDPNASCDVGQSGPVWFLAAPFGTTEHTCSIPHGKALFLTLLGAECSTLEPDPFHGDTEEQQRACAKYWADHIKDVFCFIDGHPVANLSAYRVSSPQFEFTAPTPWIFGDTGGTGTSVADGYYVLVVPLSSGTHTLRYGARFLFTQADDGFDLDLPADATFHLTVE